MDLSGLIGRKCLVGDTPGEIVGGFYFPEQSRIVYVVALLTGEVRELFSDHLRIVPKKEDDDAPTVVNIPSEAIEEAVRRVMAKQREDVPVPRVHKAGKPILGE